MSILTRGAVDLYALFEWGLTAYLNNLLYIHNQRNQLIQKKLRHHLSLNEKDSHKLLFSLKSYYTYLQPKALNWGFRLVFLDKSYQNNYLF